MAKAKAATEAPQPMSLFEIGTEFLELEAAMKATGGEWTEEMEQRFGSIEALERAQKHKADGYIALLKRSELTEAAIKAQAQWHDSQAKALRAQAKTEENFRDRLKDRLVEHTRRLKVKEIAGSIWTIARHLTGGTRKVIVSVPAEKLPESFRKWVLPTEGHWVADEDAIRMELVNHERYVKACQVEGITLIAASKLDGMAELEPQGEHIKIA